MDSINLILMDLVLAQLDLMRELITPQIIVVTEWTLRHRDSNRCLVPTNLAFTLFTTGSMDFILSVLQQEVMQNIFNVEWVLS